MKVKLILIATLGFAALPAQAQAQAMMRVVGAKPNRVATFIDRKTVKPGATVDYTITDYFETPLFGGTTHIVSTATIDCAASTFKVTGRISYGAYGAELQRERGDADPVKLGPYSSWKPDYTAYCKGDWTGFAPVAKPAGDAAVAFFRAN